MAISLATTSARIWKVISSAYWFIFLMSTGFFCMVSTGFFLVFAIRSSNVYLLEEFYSSPELFNSTNLGYCYIMIYSSFEREDGRISPCDWDAEIMLGFDSSLLSSKTKIFWYWRLMGGMFIGRDWTGTGMAGAGWNERPDKVAFLSCLWVKKGLVAASSLSSASWTLSSSLVYLSSDMLKLGSSITVGFLDIG